MSVSPVLSLVSVLLLIAGGPVSSSGATTAAPDHGSAPSHVIATAGAENVRAVVERIESIPDSRWLLCKRNFLPPAFCR
ncbi:hypothetical protein [Nesterenkonia sp. PF2B19]|uniref:hypothetical protein n=1 Tax=unclassified Nesterenkonia TaxID=2629769 RepID=UPI000871FAEE|nr:hypothetical protein [Nesterenkonia sp. PF2B19]OSM42870.1 hypothetical protein BCY76_011810 [Nesterenkonia sp. PF2B19]